MRFGLIGLGGIGRVRMKALEESSNCSFTAVYDLDKNINKLVGKDVQIFDSFEALANSDACDAVIISTPPNFHLEQAVACMEGGKHVIVEKPMASSLEECRKMLETSRRTGKVLTVGFNHRYFDAIKTVRNAIQSGEIGELSYIRAYGGHTGLSEFKSPWMYDKDIMGGGTLMDNGIHVLDLTQHLMGGVKSVYGITLGDIWKLDRSEDNGFALLRGNNGVVASLHSSWTEWKGYHFSIEAYGTLGTAKAYYAPMMSTVITMDHTGGPKKTKRNFYLPAIFREKFKGWQTTVIKTFLEELNDFVKLTKGETNGLVIADAIEGYRSIEIVNGIYESSKSGIAVTMQDNI